MLGHQEVICLALLWEVEKARDSPFYYQVSGYSISLKVVSLKKKKKSLSLPPFGLEKQNAFTNWGHGGCEFCSSQET